MLNLQSFYFFFFSLMFSPFVSCFVVVLQNMLLFSLLIVSSRK